MVVDVVTIIALVVGPVQLYLPLGFLRPDVLSVSAAPMFSVL